MLPRGESNLTKVKLIPYHSQTEKLLAQFEKVAIIHVRRAANMKADALARLAAPLFILEGETSNTMTI